MQHDAVVQPKNLSSWLLTVEQRQVCLSAIAHGPAAPDVKQACVGSAPLCLCVLSFNNRDRDLSKEFTQPLSKKVDLMADIKGWG
jgi:hypothetical protein